MNESAAVKTATGGNIENTDPKEAGSGHRPAAGEKPPSHGDLGSPFSDDERLQLVKSFLGMTAQREELMKNLDSLKGMDVVQTVIDVLIDDGFDSSLGDKMFTVTYIEKEEKASGEEEEIEGEENDKIVTEGDPDKADQEVSGTEKEVNDEIQLFLKKVKLHRFVKNILEDLMTFGEYPFRIISEEGVGIKELVDDVDLVHTAAVYASDEIKFFLEKKGTKVTMVEPDDMAHFCLSARKGRVPKICYIIT